MSWFRIAAAVLALTLTACGFSPVYGPGGAGGVLQNAVLVEAPKTRDAFLLTQRIEERLGRANPGRFGLTVEIEVVQQRLAIDPGGDTTRFNLIGEAAFTLRDLNTGEILQSGRSETFTGYSATGSTVATLAAEQDARARLMVMLADQIIARLLSAPPPGS